MKRMNVSLILICFLFIALITPAFADNAGLTEKDSQPILKLPKNDKDLQLDKKRELELQKLFKLEQDVRAGKVTKDKYITKFREYSKKWHGLTNVTPSVTGINNEVQPLDVGIRKVLGVNEVGQEKEYYCGPASAVQLLLYKNITSNPNDNRTTTQDNLANDLHTNKSGTGFDGYWEETLEDWTNETWTAKWGPSENDLWNYVKADVDAKRPLIFDTVMNSKYGYLPGYNSGTIYHYVTGDGYYYHTFYGDEQIHYVDPNRYRTSAFGPHWVTLEKMTSVLQARGIVY